MLIMWYRNLFIKITYMYSSLLKRRLQRAVLRITAAPRGRGAARGPDPAEGDPGRHLPQLRPLAAVGLRPGAHQSPSEAAGGLPGCRGRKPPEGMTARTAPRGEHPASKLRFWTKGSDENAPSDPPSRGRRPPTLSTSVLKLPSTALSRPRARGGKRRPFRAS